MIPARNLDRHVPGALAEPLVVRTVPQRCDDRVGELTGGRWVGSSQLAGHPRFEPLGDAADGEADGREPDRGRLDTDQPERFGPAGRPRASAS